MDRHEPNDRKHPTVFQRTVPLNHEYTLFFWLGVSVVAILVGWWTSPQAGSWTDAYFAIIVYLALGFTTVPLGIGIGYRILREWAANAGHFAKETEPEIGEWFHREMEFVRGDVFMGFCGVGLGSLSLYAFTEGGYFAGYSKAQVAYLGLVMFASAAFAGMGLYAIFRTSRVFWRLGNLDSLSLTVHEHRFGVLSIGAALFKCWLIIGGIWAIYCATAFVGYTGATPNEIIRLPPMWLLAYPTLPFIVGTFLVCQVPLHRKMLAYKHTEICRLDEMLDEIRPESIGSLENELRSNIEFLEKQKAQVRALPDWPFNKSSLLGTGASSLMALLPVMTSKEFPQWIEQFVLAIR